MPQRQNNPPCPPIWVGATSQDVWLVTWPVSTNQGPVFRSRDQCWPITAKMCDWTLWWDQPRHLRTRAKMNDIHQIRRHQHFLIVPSRLWLCAQVTSHWGVCTMLRSVLQFNCLQLTSLWRLLLLLLQLHGTEVAMNFTITREDGTDVKINVGHTCIKAHHWPLTMGR